MLDIEYGACTQTLLHEICAWRSGVYSIYMVPVSKTFLIFPGLAKVHRTIAADGRW